VRVHCLIDNCVSRQSTYWGEHGLSMLIEHDGVRLLYDTGGSGDVLLHNLDAAGVAPERIDAVVLSHNHRDHTGGLEALLERTASMPVYAHPAALEEHFSRRTGSTLPKGLTFDLRARASNLRLGKERAEIFPGMFISGEIQPRHHPEGRSTHHVVRAGNDWIPDPYLDDQALVLESGEGLVLVCGCCHAGLLNTLDWVENQFSQTPVIVMGGLHLASAEPSIVETLMEALAERGAPQLYPNHCTGEEALIALTNAFPGKVHPFPAGSTLTID